MRKISAKVWEKVKEKKRNVAIALILVSLFVVWSVILYYNSPASIVDMVGVKNSYLLLSIVAFFGGTSLFIPFPYYLFTISFGAAGLNPFLLGIAAGIGTLLGDSISYYIGYKGRAIAPTKVSQFFTRLFHKLTQKHPFFLRSFVFVYAAVVPFSDDLIMVPAGLARYPFRPLAISVGLGKVVFNTLLAFSGLYGWNLIF